MKPVVLYIILSFILLISCNSNNNDKKSSSEEDQTPEKSIADFRLDFDGEKIALLATIKQISQDTLFNILKDYLEYMEEREYQYGLDSIRFIANEAIEFSSKKNGLPKNKVASLIFNFKYELLTKQDIIDEIEADEEFLNTQDSYMGEYEKY